jgi:hypothetical protein
MFDDFQGGRTIIHIMPEASESMMPVPSGIAIEIKGVGSRQLSHDWAGEWLGSPLAQQIQSTASAMTGHEYPSGGSVVNNGSGSSLTANSLAALQAELSFQRMMQGTPLDPNYTGERSHGRMS